MLAHRAVLGQQRLEFSGGQRERGPAVAAVQVAGNADPARMAALSKTHGAVISGKRDRVPSSWSVTAVA
jgi:hypothetical protein